MRKYVMRKDDGMLLCTKALISGVQIIFQNFVEIY